MSPPLATLGDDPAAIAVVVVLIGALLLVDLLVFARGREPTFAESVRWSVAWLVLGLVAGGAVVARAKSVLKADAQAA